MKRLIITLALVASTSAFAQETSVMPVVETASYVLDNQGIMIQGIASAPGQAGFIVSADGQTMRSQPGPVGVGLYAMRLNGLDCSDRISYQAVAIIDGREVRGGRMTIPVRCGSASAANHDNVLRELAQRERVARSAASNQ